MRQPKNVAVLNTIVERHQNLDTVVESILPQVDTLYINLVGYDLVPSRLKRHKKIKPILMPRYAGSETRLLYRYHHPNDYYFPIDDDIIYPANYCDRHISVIQQLDKKQIITCVHGSIINKQQGKDYYKRGRVVFMLDSELRHNTAVDIPGTGTSCFPPGIIPDFELNEFPTRNMTDVVVGCKARKQSIEVVSITRPKNWLKQVNQHGTSIWGNNPHTEIDELINRVFTHVHVCV